MLALILIFGNQLDAQLANEDSARRPVVDDWLAVVWFPNVAVMRSGVHSAFGLANQLNPNKIIAVNEPTHLPR